MKKQNGSAILIAILLVTAIGGLAFSLGRLLLLEIANTSINVNGISAYYAAESGIEEGFLRYKYDPNAEEPFDWDIARGSLVYAFNLKDRECTGNLVNNGCGSPLTGIAKNSVLIDNSRQHYALRMGSEVSAFGLDVDSPANGVTAGDLQNPSYPHDKDSEFVINRDESKKFDMNQVFQTSNDINFLFKPIDGTQSASTTYGLSAKDCTLIEAKITATALGSTQERKVLLKNASGLCGQSNLTEGVLTYDVVGGVATVLNIKSKIWPTVPLTNASLFIKPIGSSISFAFTKPAGNSKALYGPNSTITSTGYYGGVTRTLEANIDRQSGSLYDLFDYVIYKYEQ